MARAESIKTKRIFFAQGPQIMYLSTHMIYCDACIWFWEFHILFSVLNYVPSDNWLKHWMSFHVSVVVLFPFILELK